MTHLQGECSYNRAEDEEIQKLVKCLFAIEVFVLCAFSGARWFTGAWDCNSSKTTCVYNQSTRSFRRVTDPSPVDNNAAH